MSLKAHEAAIISRLESQISGTPVESFPENPQSYKMNHPVAALLVVYGGSQYNENQGGNVVVQNRRQDWDVVVVSRNLSRIASGAHSNAYDLLDAVRTAITGFQIAGFTKFYPRGERFLRESGGIWWYSITFGYHGTHKES